VVAPGVASARGGAVARSIVPSPATAIAAGDRSSDEEVRIVGFDQRRGPVIARTDRSEPERRETGRIPS
jgi:hypothetical protein